MNVLIPTVLDCDVPVREDAFCEINLERVCRLAGQSKLGEPVSRELEWLYQSQGIHREEWAIFTKDLETVAVCQSFCDELSQVGTIDSMTDLCCGIGTLSLACSASLGITRVSGVDVNERWLRCFQQLSLQQNESCEYRFVKKDITKISVPSVELDNLRSDIVVANPQFGPVIAYAIRLAFSIANVGVILILPLNALREVAASPAGEQRTESSGATVELDLVRNSSDWTLTRLYPLVAADGIAEVGVFLFAKNE
ncbi:methyltransferase domain-containing protein [Roseiconus lacunae]|uniref:methyltransferase domain-containing protein n=1 Tax=Roseiconus lacunae TaxID=2605694 RepID=UPI00135CB093|nr:methyltransferase domain-containing protein [Roseiconus lacunae]